MANISAAALAAALGGKSSGGGWLCGCPAHRDLHPSFFVVERGDKVLVNCRSGCSQGAVIAALKRRGLWGRGARPRAPLTVEPPALRRQAGDPLKSWRRALPVFPGCPVDVYLRRTRGIALFADEASSLRFHPSLYHWPCGSNFPAMLALVRDAAWRELTVHQTFLDFDGLAKAPVERPKLFPAGASPLGGGVWFGGVIGPAREFAVAEGIETLLSAMRLLNVNAGCAALSARGLRELTLPAEARRIAIFADRDPKGQGLEAARAASLRWKLEGRAVRVVLPDRDGEDANDILRRLARG